MFFLNLSDCTCHCEAADQQADITARQHHIVRVGVGAGLFGFPAGPDADAQDEEVEHDDGDQPSDVDHHDDGWRWSRGLNKWSRGPNEWSRGPDEFSRGHG